MSFGEIIIIALLAFLVAEVHRLHKRLGLLSDALEEMAKKLKLI